MMVASACSTSGQLSAEQLTLVPGSAVYSSSQYVAAAYWTQNSNCESSLVEMVSGGCQECTPTQGVPIIAYLEAGEGWEQHGQVQPQLG